MLDFQQYQCAFTAHIRDPKAHAKPVKVPDARMAVYREIVFNNVFSTISACFPVCQTMLGKRRWKALCRAFFAQHASTSPLFRDIPKAFLAFIQTQTLINSALLQLAHYEWAELAVSTMESTTPAVSQTPNLGNERIVFTETHMLLTYDYAVHTLSKSTRNIVPTPTFILMFRNRAFEVKFIVLNALTFTLLQQLQTQPLTAQQALLAMAEAISHPAPDSMVAFGLASLDDLMRQEAIIGTSPLE